MKYIILSLILFSSFQAKADWIYCSSKYFNRSELKSVFTANISSETSLKNATLKIENELVFKADQLNQVEYRPSPAYENYISLSGNFESESGTWNITKILLEKDFIQKDKFFAVIAETAGDGGSYNRFTAIVITKIS